MVIESKAARISCVSRVTDDASSGSAMLLKKDRTLDPPSTAPGLSPAATRPALSRLSGSPTTPGRNATTSCGVMSLVFTVLPAYLPTSILNSLLARSARSGSIFRSMGSRIARSTAAAARLFDSQSERGDIAAITAAACSGLTS